MQVKRLSHLSKQGNSKNSGVSNKCCNRFDNVGHYQSSVDCPARNQQCRQIGHFARCCKTKTKPNLGHRENNRTKNPKSSVQFIDSQSVTPSIQTEELHNAFSVIDRKKPKILIILGNVDIDMMMDSGASCNVIDQATWEWLKSRKIKCTSMRT